MSSDDAIFLFPPGKPINTGILFDERKQGVPFLHRPSHPLTDDQDLELELDQMIKKPKQAALAEEMVIVDAEDDITPLPKKTSSVVAKPKPKKSPEKMVLEDLPEDDDDDSDVEVIGEEPGDDENEEEDEEEDEEDELGIADDLLSKFAMKSLGMEEDAANAWAENFSSDRSGDLDEEAHRMTELIADLLLRAVSNKKAPFPDCASDASLQFIKDHQEQKNAQISAI